MLTVAFIWINNFVRKNENETKKVDDPTIQDRINFFILFSFFLTKSLIQTQY